MNISEMKIIIDRWENLYDKRYSVDNLKLNAPNLEIFIKNLINDKTFKEASELLDRLEKVDNEFKIECERKRIEQETSKVKNEIKLALDDTTWSMLSDAPLSQEGKQLYRDYRQYLRDIPDLFKRSQIKELKVMTFEEWKSNPPIYKVERKVIL